MEVASEEFDTQNSLLRVTLAGAFSLPEAQARFAETLDGLLKHQPSKVLVDGRAITGRPELIQRYLYGEFAANALRTALEGELAQAPKFVYVLVEPVLDPGRIGQTVALINGMNVMTFGSVSDAEHWLDAEES